jgi:peptidoglycan/xylan/chitin deacetylase (PgdA/CDA1 family)
MNLDSVKQQIINGYLFFNMPAFFLNKMKGKGIVIMYHGVDFHSNTMFNTRFVSVKSLEKQLIYFKKHCNVLTSNDFFLKKFDKDKCNLTITFDDGYKNNFELAMPLFEKYKLPATFFVTGLNKTKYNILWADFLDLASFYTNKELLIEDKVFIKKQDFYVDKDNNERLLDFIKKESRHDLIDLVMKLFLSFKNVKPQIENNKLYWELMSDNEIEASSKFKYVEIGSHAYSHLCLGNLSNAEARNEIQLSKGYLENVMQKEVTSVAYPDGSYTRDLISFCKSIGFKNQYAVGYLFEEDMLDLNIQDRIGIYPTANTNYMLYSIFK